MKIIIDIRLIYPGNHIALENPDKVWQPTKQIRYVGSGEKALLHTKGTGN
jgi:hypothetical protein